MRIFLLVILLPLLQVKALSQNSPHSLDAFEEMLSVGKVPNDFKASSTSKYRKDLGTIDSALKRKD